MPRMAERHDQDSITIRRATEHDTSLILQFIRELAEYERLTHEVVTDEAQIRRWVFGPTPVAEAIIAECEGGPVGFALYFTNYSTFVGKPGIYLEDLFVRPAFRGHGAGRALLARLAAIAVERGYGRVEWAVLDWNEPAIGFYRTLGAVPMHDWTVFRLAGVALDRLAASAPPK